MRKSALLLSMIFLASAIAREAPAQMIGYKPNIGSEAAKIMGEACEAYARENGWAASISVVDNAGYLIYMHRMQGAVWLSVEPSRKKAMTVLMIGRPNSGEAAMAAQRGEFAGTNVALMLDLLMAGGGLPIIVDGETAGAIGVGGTAGQDEACAQIGIDAISN